MPRPKLTEDRKLVTAQTRLAPAVIEQVEQIAQERDWSFGQTLRKLVERGLSVETASAQPRIARRQKVAA